ncbi:MAG: multidrug ABC transporter permease [Porticoccaceae bacterium]|nr:multidrug ABC transporter permease [Porticoccaceae bacterium]
MSNNDNTGTGQPIEQPSTTATGQPLFRPRTSNRRTRLVMSAAVVLIVAGGVAWLLKYLDYGRFQQETNDATIQADQVTISSKLEGYVRRVAVVENQAVEDGALLVEIDPTDYSTRLKSAEAEMATAAAAENAARAALAEAESAIDHARASLVSAQTSWKFAVGEVERHQPLVDKGVTSAALMSQLVVEQDRARADVAAAEAALQQVQRRFVTIKARIAETLAQVQAAQVTRLAAENDLNATRITSPVAGQVANSTVRIGQFVQAGMRLMTIVPTDDIYVVANFKETQIGLMRPGQPATIRVDALPDMEFSGVVTSITPGTGANFSLIPPQNATGNFTKIVQRVPVRIHINAGPSARQVLVPGLSLEVEVDTRAGRNLLATIEAEQRDQGL